MKEVVWGIIGCGNVTEVKSGPAFNLAKNSTLLAVMRRDKDKAKDYAERHNVAEYYDSADAIINHPKINAVYIATPPSTHLQYALKVLAVNKNVYLEKPMTFNSGEAILLEDALENSTSKLTVAHYRRRLPMFLEIKRLIDEKVLGDINSVNVKMFQARRAAFVADSESNWRINPAISGGGYFNDLAPHQLDLLLFWFGDISDFSGRSSTENSKPNVASKVSGVLNFKNGISCKGNWNFIADEAEQIDECYISGTKGSVAFPFFGNEIVLEFNGKREVLKFEHPMHIQQPMIQATVNYFLEKGDNPCTVEDGLKGMRIIDAFIN